MTLQPLSGSKADGIVTLGFDYTNLVKPHWDWRQGQQVAERMCKGWGYTGATRFDNGNQTCNHISQSHNRIGNLVLHTNECTAARLTVKYQCTNS
jgi:hypothetical protein